MKISLLLCILSLFQIQAGSGGQLTRISIDIQGASLQQIFEEVEAKTEYKVLFRNDDVKYFDDITITAEQIPVDDIIIRALNGTGLAYKVLANQIVIYKPSTIHDRRKENTTESRQEQRNITGNVTSMDGAPLFGVTVVNQNTVKGTVTDELGQYSIKASIGDSLSFSYLGYVTEKRVIGIEVRIDLTLEEDINELEEVMIVSTGFQKIEKASATGSFSSVKEEQLGKPSTNISSRLIGVVPGVQAFVDENGDASFEIRGQSSLNANRDPLVVVDGFPIQGGFNSINPNDVETVTILKDAAAASIWGAKSSNGVIVVTTKKSHGKSPLKVEFSTFTRFADKLDLDYVNPLATSEETVAYEIESFNNWRAPIPDPVALPYYFFNWSEVATTLQQAKLGNIPESERDRLLQLYRTSSNKEQIRNNLLAAPMSNQYNLSLSGGGERMSNFLSLMYEENQSNYKETYSKEYMVNYRTNAAVFKWLDLNVSAMLQKQEFTNNGVTLSDIQGLSPYEMLIDETGGLNSINRYYKPLLDTYIPQGVFPFEDWGYNPIQEINNRSVTSDPSNIRLQGGLTFKILPGFSVNTRLQYENIKTSGKAYYGEETFYVRNLLNTTSSWDMATNTVTPNLPIGGVLSRSSSDLESYNFRAQINYDHLFNQKHRINFIGGTEIIDTKIKSYGYPITYGYDPVALTSGIFPNGATGTRNFLGQSQTFSYASSFSKSTDRYFSTYANLTYTFDDKYSLSGSFRTDASNLITDDPSFRYDPFWSAGFSWRAGQENFLKDINWLADLTFRGSYGYNGNVDKSTSFKPLISYASTPNIYTGDQTASISNFGNPSLRWERTRTINFGLDFSLFRRSVFGSVDVYNKKSEDLVASISIPAANGTDTQRFNNASMLNKGIEVAVGTSIPVIGNKVRWTGNINFSYNDNEITDLYVVNYNAYTMIRGGSASYVEGNNAQSLWTMIYGGLDEDGRPTHLGPNDEQYNFVLSSLPGNGLDYVVNKGTLVAPYVLGFTSAFDIYDFNLSFIVTGKFGHVFKRQAFNYPSLFTTKSLPNSSLSEIRNSDPSEVIPLPTTPDESMYYLWDRYYPYMDYLATNASHIRMQEINLTYNLPLDRIMRSNAKVQFTLQANNVFTILANNYGEDPEYPLGTINPQPTITLGTKFTF
ncbi:SusC/RagA family TonB-linked outer membrane protein [Robertkochia solimangrovi]|uniref:SusC/RagA family TonB-linked outer membrane protein n=1 Tax=Robertkochia solimangrovi TaxID=2213046 RepID=UPI0013A55A04|nr:SusC/RagA family TonB-linked outer membrane protein [Robertkochia solimangrovi]